MITEEMIAELREQVDDAYKKLRASQTIEELKRNYRTWYYCKQDLKQAIEDYEYEIEYKNNDSYQEDVWDEVHNIKDNFDGNIPVDYNEKHGHEPLPEPRKEEIKKKERASRRNPECPVFKKVCTICGKEYETKRMDSETCSPVCSKLRSIVRGRARSRIRGMKDAPSAEEKMNIMKELSHKVAVEYGVISESDTSAKNERKALALRNEKPCKRICTVCGKPFANNNMEILTCSTECSKIRSLARYRMRSKERTCNITSEEERKKVFQKTCWEVALAKGYMTMEDVERASKIFKVDIPDKVTCKICGKEFYPSNGFHCYCSKECGALRKHKSKQNMQN